MSETIYRCENPACSLGAVGAPGRFTGGITPTGYLLLTGNPYPGDTTEGVCPNCGKPGTPETEE